MTVKLSNAAPAGPLENNIRGLAGIDERLVAQQEVDGALALPLPLLDHVAGDDEKDAAMLSYARNLGPGVKWSVNFIWADYTGEDPGSADDNDGTALSTSLRMIF